MPAESLRGIGGASARRLTRRLWFCETDPSRVDQLPASLATLNRMGGSIMADAASARRTAPKVSLCIPAYQAERHLQTTLESVLAQDYRDMEVLVIDNNSSDRTADILKGFNDDRLRVIRNASTLPMVDNFNHAVRSSRGRFVKVMCADDTLEPDCIATQCKVLEEHPDVALVAVRTDFIDEDGDLLRRARGLKAIAGWQPRQRVVREIVRSGCNPIGGPVVGMFRRTDFDRCGGFREEFTLPVELDLWVRLLHYGDFVGLPRTLASFRISGLSVTASISMRLQLAEQIEFNRRLHEDPQWTISSTDHLVGRVNCYVMQLRRSAIYVVSALRTLRRSRVVPQTA